MLLEYCFQGRPINTSDVDPSLDARPARAAMADDVCPTPPPNLALMAVEAGVDPSRVVWSTFFRKETEFLIKGLADLFVDTPNFNAHTTGRAPTP